MLHEHRVSLSLCGGDRRTHRITLWLWVAVTTDHTESLSDSELGWPQNTQNHSDSESGWPQNTQNHSLSRGDHRTHRITLRLQVWVTTEHTESLSDSESGWPQNTQNTESGWPQNTQNHSTLRQPQNTQYHPLKSPGDHRLYTTPYYQQQQNGAITV